ncbi:transporter [Sphingomonas sp. SUN039]|uniref:transporter n=1 Tax=Sphingomonas sp. SUN039 TaxID=2937787 RepID=UPI0021640355|nr:transporter [Sphingomonas sp. SUN039]UVO53851.1 transporter [Sphingomonas sp. SUN039]
MRYRILLPAFMAVAAPALGEERYFCASRPGLNTPPCIVERGHPVLELGLVDWTLSRQPGSRTDTIASGQAVLRVALGESTEVQVGWTAFGTVRTADRVARTVQHDSGTGDVTLALRQSLGKANGPIAIQPYITLPTGGTAIGAGDWGAGVLLPIGVPLGHGIQLAVTPQVAAAVNSSRSGRHFAYGAAAGLSTSLAEGLSGAVEVSATRDEDPGGAKTKALASTSLAWMAGKNTQLDIGTVAGLNSDSPDIEVYFGITRRF